MKIIKGLSFFSLFFFILISSIAFLFSLVVKAEQRNEIISPIVETVKEQERQLYSLFATGLDEKIQAALKGTTGTYSIVIVNLTTGESYDQNPDRKYLSASLYKLWLIGAVLQEIKNGNLKEDQVLKAEIPDLNEEFKIASEEAELTEGTVTRTVKEAMEKAIIVSDNYSALLLTHAIGTKKLAAFLKQIELTNTKLASPPETTASDIAKFYLKLYRKEIVDEQSSTTMLEILKRQALNDRIPKYLPDGTQVAHKTGELYGFKHDAGIVFTDEGDYIITVLTESKDPAAAAERIARISETVYQYFQEAHKN